MEIFGEFDEDDVVTSDWYFRPARSVENVPWRTNASSGRPRQNDIVHQNDDVVEFSIAIPGRNAVQAVEEQFATAQAHYMKSRFDRPNGKNNPHFEQIFQHFQGRREQREARFDERGRALILTRFGFCPFTDLGVPQQRRRLMVNHNGEEEIEQLDDEADLSINEIALHAMDNIAMLISELAALGAFKLHDSVDEVRVAAVQKQLREDISDIIACTRSIAALREQLLGVNVKAERAA
jgi:hypothetical protein